MSFAGVIDVAAVVLVVVVVVVVSIVSVFVLVDFTAVVVPISY